MNDTRGELVALVTGAASGIGKATVLLYIQRGHRVVAVDRNADGLRATVAEADTLGSIAARVSVAVNAMGSPTRGSSSTAPDSERPLHWMYRLLEPRSHADHLVLLRLRPFP